MHGVVANIGNSRSNLLGQMAGPVWRVENLVVEDREVECQSQANGVRWLHLASRYFECFLVRALRVVHYASVSMAGTTVLVHSVRIKPFTSVSKLEKRKSEKKREKKRKKKY